MSGVSVCSLASVLRIQNGFAFNSKQFSADCGMPLIRIRDLKNGVSTETNFKGEFDRRYVVKAGDFLIGMDGEFGCHEWRGPDALLNQRVCKLTDFAAGIEPRFLFYGINKYLKEIEDHTTFTTVKHISSKQIADIEFPLPPLEDQRRIVAVLDEACAAIATATANAEKNLANANELYEGYLAQVFRTEELNPNFSEAALEMGGMGNLTRRKRSKDLTSTGGREATTRPIQGRRALGVGPQKSLPPEGWEWRSLTSLARLESGHTPSRRKSEYWGGSVPWIGIRDAKAHHGETISATSEMVTEVGISNSSARILPSGTVCFSRTASVGYVVITGRKMATSQDFLNWVCSDEIVPQFLQYLFIAQGDEIFRFSSGAVHQTIYYPEAKAFFVCIPPPGVQQEIVTQANALKETRNRLDRLYRAKLSALAALKQSFLHRAFAGELTPAERELVPA